jgi:hypothetical protein
MPYTGSQAQSGDGTLLEINTGTASTPTWTAVGEITDLQQSGKSNKTDDTTNLQSTAEEFIPTLLAPGKWALTLNRVAGDAGQVAVKASFDAKTLKQYRITLPMLPAQVTNGDRYAFTALVEEFNDLSSVKADKKVTTQAALKVSGSIPFTAGA